MKTRLLGCVIGAILMSGVVSAQEAADDDAEPRREPVRRIKVLQHPYDLASFYRSSPSSRPVYFGGPIVEAPAGSRYPIASFYRQGGGQGRYSQFWTAPRAGSGHPRTAARRRSRRVEASDLCLIAPTFLAPAAPLTGLDR